MFTGIVTAIGRLERSEPRDGGLDLRISCPYQGLVEGESVAVDGACLTVTAAGNGWFEAHTVISTLERTRFTELAPGAALNLERAVTAGSPLGGHLVQGHVDGIGTVERVRQEADALLIDFRVPDAVERVSIPLGSVTVDGVSLTVNALPGHGIIQVSLVPYTVAHTTLGRLTPGERVHLEGDVVGKYLRAFMERRG
ncbi:MAG TPA: riboflavin synthase [Gemmatimonadales bacterium]|nr:riboflavin synthase [Gemmatimonadales bacterium]